VPKTVARPGDRSVFVEDAAESVVTSDAHLVEVEGFRQSPQGSRGGQARWGRWVL